MSCKLCQVSRTPQRQRLSVHAVKRDVMHTISDHQHGADLACSQWARLQCKAHQNRNGLAITAIVPKHMRNSAQHVRCQLEGITSGSYTSGLYLRHRLFQSPPSMTGTSSTSRPSELIMSAACLQSREAWASLMSGHSGWKYRCTLPVHMCTTDILLIGSLQKQEPHMLSAGRAD